jgi:hypothetical protein
MLEKWYEYENQAQSEALKKWCYENNLENKWLTLLKPSIYDSLSPLS